MAAMSCAVGMAVAPGPGSVGVVIGSSGDPQRTKMAKDIVYWFRTRVGGRELGFVLIRFITQKGVGARESYCTDWGFDYGRAAITARAKKPLSEKTTFQALAEASILVSH